MKPHSSSLNGYYQVVNSKGVITTSGFLTTWTDVVTQTTVNGDFKSPNNSAYTARMHNFYKGKLTTVVPSDTNYPTVFTGPNGQKARDRVTLISKKDLLYNIALQRLYEQLRGDLDLSTAVAEASESKRLLTSIHRLENYVTGSGKWKTLQTAGKNWLAYSMAWKPMVQDIYGAADELVRAKYPSMLRINSSAQEKMPGNVRLTKLYASDPEQVATLRGVEGVRFRTMWIDDGKFDIARWTSLNPVSIGWELMPYSFVVDYFYDVGNMLRSYETAMLYNTKFKSGYWN
jgi:hypothetical protein